MNLKAGLFQQQSLKLSMTQELSQAIALLQYSAEELTSFLENKTLENPLLLLENNQPSYQTITKKGNKIKSDKDQKYFIEQIGHESHSLEKHLLSQLHMSELSGEQSKIYLQLIRNIDENGYLRASLTDVAYAAGVKEELVSNCLETLHELEPYGIGARNLQECLLIQARHTGLGEMAEKILSEEFQAFAEKKWKQLSKKLSVPLKEIQDIFDSVQNLNPRPGSGFNHENPAYVVPDVIVKYIDDEFMVMNFEPYIPKVAMNEPYFKQMQEHKDKQVNQFINEKWQEYQWIARGIQQRKETIVKVMSKIIQLQPECFYKGLAFLKPMTMREIAEQLDIHESTVSRAVKGKYVQTPFGTLEMRVFFTSNLQSTSEEDVSALRAKKAIQEVVCGENKQKPLSDQDIASILKQAKGIVLSRRTVAKYRDQLSIPASSKRKRYE